MGTMLEVIEKRHSVRTYSEKKVEEGIIKEVADFTRKNNTGPFGNKISFSIIEIKEDDLEDIKSLGTYGIIRGANIYLTGSVNPGDYAMEDFGYCMQTVILKATESRIGNMLARG